MDHFLFQQPLLHVPVQRLQPGLTALDHPVGHSGTAQLHALSCPDFLLTGQGQTIGILLCHNVCHRGRGCKAVFHEGNRRLHIGNVGKTSILFAVVTGIGHGIVGQQLRLTGNNLQLMTDKLLANGLECAAALAADALLLRQLQQDLLLSEPGGHLLQGALLLTGMGLDSKSFLGGFLRLVVLLLFCLVEQTHLICAENIGRLLAGLTKPCSLGIGKDLVHVVQLALQFFDLSLLCLNLTLLSLDGVFQSGYFRSGICVFCFCCGHKFSSENRFILPLL